MTPTSERSESAAKKDVQKLQRAIIDGLEDVKAQDIVVFNTEAISSLFERVIIASGTSNRQTKALAASVRDAVREAGFAKPRIEGEENGEWIIVDCGAAVAHIMQPTIRQYYHLEEIWGDKPVRIKFGATKPEAAPEQPVAAKKAGKKADATPSLRRSSAVKTAERTAKQEKEQAERAERAGAKSAPRKRAAGAKSATTTTAKSSPKTAPATKPTKVVVKAPGRAAPRAAAPAKTAAKSSARPASKAPSKAAAKPAARSPRKSA